MTATSANCPIRALSPFQPHQTVALRPGGQGVLRVVALAVHQHPHRFAHIGGVELGGHIVLDLQEPVKPLLLLRPGGRVRHGRGLGAGAGGVDEGEQGVKPHLLHQGHGVHGLRLRLAGEADDDVGGQYQPGHDPLGVVHQIQVLLPGVAAVHLFQDPVVAGLEGQVQLLGHMRACGHHVKQPGRGVLGVAGHEADEIFSRESGRCPPAGPGSGNPNPGRCRRSSRSGPAG